jgi:hypothetical protein
MLKYGLLSNFLHDVPKRIVTIFFGKCTLFDYQLNAPNFFLTAFTVFANTLIYSVLQK